MPARKDSAVCTLFISLKSGGFTNINLDISMFRDFVTKLVSKGTSPADYLILGTGSTGQIVPVRSRGGSGRRPAPGETESGELTEWQEVGLIYRLDVARSISF